MVHLLRSLACILMVLLLHGCSLGCDPREMPVWGIIFDEKFKDEPYPRYTGLLRARVLADYLRTLQRE